VFVALLLDLHLLPVKTPVFCEEDLISMGSWAALLAEVLGFFSHLFCLFLCEEDLVLDS
jgi:hypothetical protein